MNTKEEEKFKQIKRKQKDFVIEFLRVILKYKKLYFKVLPVTFVVVAVLTLCMPNYYKCEVMLAPELTSTKNTSSLASLASSFGINIGKGSLGSDALFPTLYPDMMNSVTFRASLFPIKVKKQDEDSVMTYYDYLLNEQRIPWWIAAKRGMISIIKSLLFMDVEESDKVNPFKLTKKQYNIVKDMEDKVVCDVDKKTLVITIDVTDQDPLIAATLADSVSQRLQDFITNYRTHKARIDFEYNKKLFRRAREKYEQARLQYARYSDANRKSIFENQRTERLKLENEMQIQFNFYSQAAAQLQIAEAKVQEETPAFTTLQPATVPIEKSGPRRSIICLVSLFFAFCFTTVYALYKENDFLPLLGIDSFRNSIKETDD